MKVSSKTEYALKTVIDLAINYNCGVCRIADIAQRQGIPPKFLEQILLILKGGGIVTSKRGINGGYRLLRSPSEVSLGHVVRLTGDLIPKSAVAVNGDGSDRVLLEVWEDINGYTTKKLDGISLQDMCKKIEEFSVSKAEDYVI